MMRAFLVDDERLALNRLSRLLEETGRVEIAGTSTDPVDALAFLSSHTVDVVFLDIQMPGMNGFEMLSMLEPQPLVVFTTAFDEYALKAFEVNSIDYLLKPIEPPELARALDKLERMRGGQAPSPDVRNLLNQLAAALRSPASGYPDRIASRLGERIQFLELSRVTHFFAEDKLTYAAMGAKNYVVDRSISELEQTLDPKKFFRIHRSTLVNLDHVHEVDAWFAGRVLLRLKDEKGTELAVARDRVRELKEKMGF